jgi:membrane protease YdiL (CAAX protease family)
MIYFIFVENSRVRRQKEGMISTINVFIKRRPVLVYYILVFAISVGGGLLVMGPGGLPGSSEQVTRLFPLAFLLLYAGPTISGPLLTGLVSGREGFRELFRRLLRWRVGVRWYAVALLSIPFLMAAAYVPLSLISPGFLPRIVASGREATPMLSSLGIAADNKAAMVLAGLVAGVMFGFLEELGWTGFAIPTLMRGHSVLCTGLIVGALWGVWHVPITIWASGDPSGAFSLTLFLPPFLFYIAVLPAYRVLMVWVYDRTKSLFVATLMHASLIASTLVILAPVTTHGSTLVIYWLVLAAALWVVVAAVTKATGWRRDSTDSRLP